MNEARDRRRREVRQYLSSQHVSFELVGRIMRFVDYRHRWSREVSCVAGCHLAEAVQVLRTWDDWTRQPTVFLYH